MKKNLIILIIICLIIVIVAAVGFAVNERQSGQISEYVTERIERETFFSIVEVNGIIQSDQTASLFWKIPGEVEAVLVNPGDQVSKGDVLALLDIETLPAYTLSAQAELISAQRALDELLTTQSQQAQALKAVEDAREALEDALHPEVIQAEAYADIAKAREALDVAQRNYEIVTAFPPQSAIDQAYSNLLLAENRVSTTEEAIEKAYNRYRGVGKSDILLPEVINDIRHSIRRLIKQLEIVLAQDKLAYEQSLGRYKALLAPPDPVDVAAAESELAVAAARLAEAQREWDRIKDGFSPAEIAVLEAELSDALREWERIKDGPHPDDIAVLEAQILAAEASIEQRKIVAPFDGTISRVHTHMHDVVDPYTPAFQLDDLSRLSVNLSVSEVDLNQVRLGQKVSLAFDAVPAKEYRGEVVKIGMVGNKTLGVTTFQVVAEIIDADDRIRPGMTSVVRIIVDEAEDVIAVPGRAIRGLESGLVVYRLVERKDGLLPSLSWRDNSGRRDGFSFPLVLQESVNYELQPVPITLGKTSNNYSEIVAGDLREGDLIVLNPPDEET
jgi:HlyD family secretion protein